MTIKPCWVHKTADRVTVRNVGYGVTVYCSDCADADSYVAIGRTEASAVEEWNAAVDEQNEVTE